MKPLVTSLAWGPRYADAALRLARSLDAHGMEYSIDVQMEKSVDSGFDCWREKPGLIARTLRKGRPVLYVDADFVFHGPADFPGDGGDCLLFSSRVDAAGRPIYEDGVTLWRPTIPALAALERWARECARPGRAWSHEALSDTVTAIPALRVGALPPAYHFVPRWAMGHRFPGVTPIIQELPLCEASSVPATSAPSR